MASQDYAVLQVDKVSVVLQSAAIMEPCARRYALGSVPVLPLSPLQVCAHSARDDRRRAESLPDEQVESAHDAEDLLLMQ